jgi:hypothetical protein
MLKINVGDDVRLLTSYSFPDSLDCPELEEGYIGRVGTVYDDHIEIWSPESGLKTIEKKHVEIVNKVKIEEFGTPQVSETGSLRYNDGKPRQSLLDPDFIEGMAKVITYGSKKYGDFNWAKGNNFSIPYDSMMRHIIAFQKGEEIDKESGIHHLFMVATNAMILYYYSKKFPQFDDRFFKE